MRLTELVAYFRNGGTFEDFCQAHALDISAEVIEIYARVPVRLESPLKFLPLDETGGRISILQQNEAYENLFDFYWLQDAIVLRQFK